MSDSKRDMLVSVPSALTDGHSPDLHSGTSSCSDTGVRRD